MEHGPLRPGDPSARGAEFCVVVLPDTQIYARDHPETFRAQTEWIADAAREESIRFVVHVGDVVHHATDEQLENADAALGVLEGHSIPYGIALGNHDHDHGAFADRATSQFDAYFGHDRFDDAAWLADTYSDADVHNAYGYLDGGGSEFLLLFLEPFPRDDVLDWAGSVLQRHPDHRAILATHAYLTPEGTRIDEENRWDCTHYEGLVGNNAPDVWTRLVEPHDNVFLVLSGHVLCEGRAVLTDVRESGAVVHQFMANYQTQDGGGNGYLVLLRFRPDAGRIDVETYSPVLDRRHPSPAHHHTLGYPSEPRRSVE